MNKFRVHHILCTSLFIGKGYSGDFCTNMAEVIDRIRKNPDEPMEVVCSPDIICAGCPNLIKGADISENAAEVCAGDRCSLDSNHVAKKDEELAEALNLKSGVNYTYRELIELARQRLTRDIFEKSCSRCSYYTDGTCSYNKLLENLDTSLHVT